MAEATDITESGLDDFSSFCPADSLPVAERDIKQPASKSSSKVRAKVAWFAKKSNSPDPSKRKSSLKHLQERNSLPPDLAIQLDEVNTSSTAVPATRTDTGKHKEGGGGGGGKNSRPLSTPAFPLDALKPLRALQDELNALKGCVSQRRAIFSPQRASSPVIHTHLPHDDHPAAMPRISPCNPVPVSPSQKESVVFPLVEYSVQVEPFVDPASSPSSSPVRLSRRGSFEYDHLEDFDPTSHPMREKDSPDGDHQVDNDSYFVTVQFNTNTAADEQVKLDDVCTHIHSTKTACQNKKAEEQEGEEGGRRGEKEDPGAYADEAMMIESQSPETASVSSHTRNPPRSLNAHISNSIPSRLNSPSLHFGATHSDRLAKGLWSSASLIQPPADPTCHCPACCSCGSSQRQLTSSVSFSHGPPVTDPRDTCSSWPRNRLCPLKRYTSDKLSNTFQRKQSISPLPAKKHSVHFSPALPTKYQTIPNYLHIKSSSIETPQQAVTTDDDLDDTYSLASLYSHHSASTFTSSLCCDQPHIPYNKGVDGSVFRQRMQVRACTTSSDTILGYEHVHVVITILGYEHVHVIITILGDMDVDERPCWQVYM